MSIKLACLAIETSNYYCESGNFIIIAINLMDSMYLGIVQAVRMRSWSIPVLFMECRRSHG